MSYSFVEYKDKGFWVHDAILSASLNYIVDAIELINNKPPWLIELFDKLSYLSGNRLYGTAYLGLDESLTDSSKIKLFNSILEKAINSLKAKGSIIPMKEFNAYLNLRSHGDNEFGRDMKTYEMVGIINGIQKIILCQADDFDFNDFEIYQRLGKIIMGES